MQCRWFPKPVVRVPEFVVFLRSNCSRIYYRALGFVVQAEQRFLFNFGGDALRCLWGKCETDSTMFAEAMWLLHGECSGGAEAEQGCCLRWSAAGPGRCAAPEDR